MILKKWNYKTHKYDRIEKPNLNYDIYKPNLNDKVNCCQCDKEIEFGDSYTSLEYHTDFGMGFAVCDTCYQKEWERRNKNETKC